MSATIDGDGKMSSIMRNWTSRTRRAQPEAEINQLERSNYMSVAASINWLSMTASPLFSFYISYLQQKLPETASRVYPFKATC